MVRARPGSSVMRIRLSVSVTARPAFSLTFQAQPTETLRTFMNLRLGRGVTPVQGGSCLFKSYAELTTLTSQSGFVGTTPVRGNGVAEHSVHLPPEYRFPKWLPLRPRVLDRRPNVLR